MANAIGKYAAKKLLRKQMAKYKTKEVSGDQVSTSTIFLWFQQY
jgi:hypothetical protein